MDRQENKLITDKLDLLDSLPDGYQPNLDSKWSLLEEAMEENKSKLPVFLWMSIAAAVFLVIGLTGVWLYLNTFPKVTVVQKAPTQENKMVPPKISVATAAKQKSISKTHRILKQTANQQVEKEYNITIPEDLMANSAVVIHRSMDSVMNQTNQQVLPPAVSLVVPKAKRPRYVQVDFDDEPIALKQTSRQNNLARRIQIKLFNTDDFEAKLKKSVTNPISINLD